MSTFPYINPESPNKALGPFSVNPSRSFGTNFSTLSVGGYMEVYSIDQLYYTVPTGFYGQINFSGNSIPINFFKGSGTTFSYDTITLNSDKISSGRRKLGMLVYVYEEEKIYQFIIDDYDTLWNNAVSSTGTVNVSKYGTTVRANSPAGIAFISAWTSNIIEGISGGTKSNSVWKVLETSSEFTGGTITGLTINGDLNVTGITELNVLSATTIYGDGTNLTNVLTGATNIGTGITISNIINNNTLELKSLTGDSLNRIVINDDSNGTLSLDLIEQNTTLWSLIVQGNRLLDGGATYVSGLTYEMTPLQYIIDGQIYTIPTSTQVTLNSGDTSFDRIDVIVATNSGTTTVVTGTASSNPEKPNIDESSEVEVTFVIVPANSDSLSINNFIVYNENTGVPTEWNFSKTGPQSSKITSSFTGGSYSGLTSIYVSGLTYATAYANYFRLSGTSVDTNQYSTFKFAIKNISAGTASTVLRIRFLNSNGSSNGNPVYMNAAGSSGYIQYSNTNVSTWQLISVPIWRFYLTSTLVEQVEFSYYIPSVSNLPIRQLYDLISFEGGAPINPPTNAWFGIRGDSPSVITSPTSPNSTLSIFGGVNLNSVASSAAITLNLDNNILLTGVTATTISATTISGSGTGLRNIPLSGVTNLQSELNNKFDKSGGTVTGDVLVTGNVTILGTATTINTETLSVKDNIISLNSNYSGNTSPFFGNSGIEILRGSATTATLLWEELNGYWGAGLSGNTKQIILSGDSLSLLNSGHTHPISQITNLQFSLDNKFDKSGGSITGLTTFTNGLISNTISATTYQNLPIDVFVTGGTYSASSSTIIFRNNTGGTFNITGITATGGGTFTGGTVSGNTIFTSGLTANTLSVTGNTVVRALTGTTGYFSGSGQNILTVIGSGNSTTSPIFTVQGSSGELFSISDSLNGSLFSVNDISGLPILEVFSDNTTLMGSYLAPSLNTTIRTSLTAGTNTIYSIPTSAYTGAFFDYSLVSTGSTGARAGNIMSIFSGTSVQYTETSTNDIGTTTGVTFSMSVSSGLARLSSSATTAGWILKTIVRSI